ncbi:hypothetical protein [Enterococcus sp. AZ180]|uniref:hypothetical protein n=1 Tax=Enterococcus sp. AZ180 TaxID=2774961 RepID=UPI003F279C89
MEWIKGNLLSFDQKLVDKLKESYPDATAKEGFTVMPVEFSFSYDNGLYTEDKTAFGIAISDNGEIVSDYSHLAEIASLEEFNEGSSSYEIISLFHAFGNDLEGIEASNVLEPESSFEYDKYESMFDAAVNAMSEDYVAYLKESNPSLFS